MVVVVPTLPEVVVVGRVVIWAISIVIAAIVGTVVTVAAHRLMLSIIKCILIGTINIKLIIYKINITPELCSGINSLPSKNDE